MRTKLMLKSALLAMAVCLTAACGSQVKEENAAQVMVARAQLDDNGENTGKIEIAMMSEDDAKDKNKIEQVFATAERRDISELKTANTSSNQFQGYYMNRPMVDNTFSSVYGAEFGRCGYVGGCYWFPGKHILRFAGRVVGGALNLVGRTLEGVGNALTPWDSGFISFRGQGCASYECSRFWQPAPVVVNNTCSSCYSQPFVSGNWGYAVYQETTYEHIKNVQMPGYSSSEHQVMIDSPNYKLNESTRSTSTTSFGFPQF